jgi:hypothetical protein
MTMVYCQRGACCEPEVVGMHRLLWIQREHFQEYNVCKCTKLCTIMMLPVVVPELTKHCQLGTLLGVQRFEKSLTGGLRVGTELA